MNDNSSDLAKVLLQKLITSLQFRDWEDSYVDVAMKERKSLMVQIVNLGEAAIDPLIELLSHSDWVVRIDVAMMLGFTNNNKIIKDLLDVMLNDKSMHVSRSAASALERIGMPEVLSNVQRWYLDKGISAEERILQKISEYMIYGETDGKLIERASELATRYRVTVHDILKARLSMSGEKPPLTPEQEKMFYESLGIIKLTSQDCVYLDELYKVTQ